MPMLLTAKRNNPLPLGRLASCCRHYVCIGVAALVAWISVLPVALAQQPLSDQQMKAAYVLNFIRYTEWPERSFNAPDAAVIVCVPGDPGNSVLAGIEGKSIKGRPIQLRAAASMEEARACHAIFIPEADTRRYVGILRALQNLPILTIGDADGFIDIGGMVGLVHFDNRLQFEINLGVAQQARLKASSQLLRLARNVIEARTR